jgi:cell filamentation protein, protein adenylyltransferase
MPELSYEINPDRNIPWNTLPLLPIQVSLYKTTEILEKLGEAKAALARLHGRSVVIPNQGLLINTISLQEAKASSAIENIFTTDDELYKAFSRQTTEGQGASKEVLRYREALWKGHAFLSNDQDFSEDYFVRIFQEIKETREGIRPEVANTIIRQGGSGPNAGQTIYTPPRGVGLLQGKLANLIEFVNDDEKYKIDHLLKMAIAHFQFEAIHPFRDGNGRAGRVFNIHYLTKKGLLDFPILYLSRYILEHKSEYYEGLMGVSQRGDWKAWILYMLNAVEATSNITYAKINSIMSSKENILNYVVEKEGKIQRPEELIERIFTQPFTRVKHLTDSGTYAENTARDYLNRLELLGILEKKILEGHHYYLNLELYNILSE